MNHVGTKTATQTKALIYCRVSDKKQKTQGHGLESQEHRCRKYAQDRGYEVEMVFPLRGFVLCDDCGEPMTSCWSKGRNQLYPYYLCDTPSCDSKRKSNHHRRRSQTRCERVENGPVISSA